MTTQPEPTPATILVHRGTDVQHQLLEDTVAEIFYNLGSTSEPDPEPEPQPDPTPTPTPTPAGPSNYEKSYLHPTASEITINMDQYAQHGILTPGMVSLTFICPNAAVNDVVSAQVEVRGFGELTFTQPVKWLTEPRTTGPGVLTARRSYFSGSVQWRLFWAAERT